MQSGCSEQILQHSPGDLADDAVGRARSPPISKKPDNPTLNLHIFSDSITITYSQYHEHIYPRQDNSW